MELLVPSTIDDLVERPTCAKLDGIKCAPLAEEAIRSFDLSRCRERQRRQIGGSVKRSCGNGAKGEDDLCASSSFSDGTCTGTVFDFKPLIDWFSKCAIAPSG